MKQKKLMIIILAALLIIGSVGTAVIVGQAKAQSGTTTQTQTATASQTQTSDSDRDEPPFGMMGYGANQEQLAKALGITTDQLSTAYTTAWGKALDQAVSLGLITQTQADRMKSNSGFGRIGMMGMFGAEDWSQIDFKALLAEALGITTEKLDAAIVTAQQAEIDAAVASGELTQEQADLQAGLYALRNSSTFTDAMKAAYKTAVADAVKAGTITQVQADAILAQLDSSNGFGGWCGGMGGEKGFGMGGGMMGGFGGRGRR